ncbi:CLUMA_CG001039, isoform A [Clunio marinus]|uniref:CLUMA_CG001039, isoform A n=1 Tax=Clunio marinus TaxID=568069 RepID=A0A1J1HGX0_9DIPT|nr:CLUMA_CG001039, isoform A [Clunio marinus]
MPIFRNAITVIIHPSFQNPNPVANDISLSRLISPVPLSIAVNVIQLPSRSDSTRSFAGHLLTASGFGWNLYEYPRYLHFTHLVGISDATCAHHHWVFLNTMICAVGANHASSTCGGDSVLNMLLNIGGPLVSTSGGIDTLIGVSTFTQTLQCVNDVQGFMRVDKYLDWISFYTGIVIRN